MIRCSDLLTLRNLLQSQGHQYLEPQICDLYMRQAVDEFVGDHPWPWRSTSLTQEMGTEFAGIDVVDQVYTADGRTLQQRDRDNLRDNFGPDLASEGEALYWYQDGDSIYSYPMSTEGVTVIFYTRYGWLDATQTEYKPRPTQDSDTPICPARCEEIVLLGARIRAKSEAQDFEQAAALREQYETRIEEERSRPDQVDEHRTIRITQGEWA